MCGSTRSTYSPSISRTSRSTPCVLGCCGPRLRSTSLVSGASPSGLLSSVPSVISSPGGDRPPLRHVFGGEVGLRRRRAFGAKRVQLVLVTPERKVLALREALEPFPHVDPAQVRVALEPDPVHVPGLALMPVGGAPDPRHRRHPRRIAEAALDPNAPYVRQRIEVVHHLVARRLGIMIDPADVGQEIEPQRRVILQKPAKLDDHVRRSGEGMNAMREAKILDCP